jgi:integrase
MKPQRRSRGEGSIQQLANGAFKVRMSYVDAAGKRHQPTAYFDTAKAARAWLHDQHSKHDRGQLADSGRRTVGQWLTEWLTMKRPQVEPNTFTFHDNNVRCHLLPVLHRTPLSKLRPSHVASLYTALSSKGVSPATQNHAGVTLSAALNDAVKMGILPSNPAKVVKKPKVSRPEIHPLDAEQVRVFLAATESDRLHALYVLAVDTGMRQGELFGLLWSEVDWSASTVGVVRSLEQKDGRHRLKDVKTKSSRRRIRVSPATIAALNQHRRKLLAKGVYRDEGPVFCDTAGNWLHRCNVYRDSFRKSLKRAGLPRVRFHDLRHTGATLMLLGGINVKAVSATLGHSNITTTLNVYAHFLPEMAEQRAEVMQKIIAARAR